MSAGSFPHGPTKRTFEAAFSRAPTGVGPPSAGEVEARTVETTFHNCIGNPAQSLANCPRRVGRPRKEEGSLKRPRRDPRSKPTKLRVNRPVRHGLNDDCWRLVFEHMDPATLLGFRMVDHTFNRILTDEDSIWLANRLNHFGKECPPPPAGIPAIRHVTSRELRYGSQLEVASEESRGDESVETMSGKVPNALPAAECQVQVSTDRVVPRGIQCRYVDLLAGSGCMLCGVKRSKSTQWAFLRRWCQNCYRESTVKTTEAKAILEKHSKLLYCIPRGVTDRWGNYASVAPSLRRHLREEDLVSQPADREVYMNVFAKSDVTRILNEFDALESSDPEEPRVHGLTDVQRKWFLRKIKQNEDHMVERRKAEEFWLINSRIGGPCQQSTSADTSRLEFFLSRARMIDADLNANDLLHIPAVRSSLKVKRPPTDRAWTCLKDKIYAALPKIKEQKSSEATSSRFEDAYSYRLARNGRRSDRDLVCPPKVLELAATALEQIEAEDVDDADFALLTLRQTWNSYAQLAKDQKPRARSTDIIKDDLDPEDHSHILTIHDALQVYESKISPHMKSWGVQRAQVGHSLKCPGCVRTDYSKPWRMRHLLNHLRDRHGRNLETPWFDIHVTANRHGYSQGFPLPAIPWRRNLPILAQHHTATGQWNPEETNYTRAPRKETHDEYPSAFAHRRPAPPSSNNGELPDRFAHHLIRASSALRETGLSSECQMKIVWEYATRQPDVAELDGQDLRSLRETSITLMREGAFSVLKDCVCKQCAAYDATRKPWQFHQNRDLYALHKHPFGAIIEHWDSHERIGYSGSKDWLKEMLLLPSGSDVAAALACKGMEEARARFDMLFVQDGKNGETIPLHVYSDGHPQRSSMLDVLAESALRQDGQLSSSEAMPPMK